MEQSLGFYPNTVYQIFASLQLYDTVNNGYVPPFRYYVSNQGRWLTPDPLAGDITNPQSLNRYAYVLNNPTTLTDPLGLQGCPNVYQAPAQCSDYGAQYGGPYSGSASSYGSPSATVAANSPGYVSGGFSPFDAVTAALGAGVSGYGEAQYIADNCIGCINFVGSLYPSDPYAHRTFSSFDAYADWATKDALLPQNQIYSAFWSLFESQGGDRNQVYPVQVYWWGLLPNVSGLGPLNTANAGNGAINDPYHKTHPGGSFIKLWPPVTTPHCANTPFRGAECHNDAFSPIWLLPLHELFDVLPSLFINPQDNPNTRVPTGMTTWKCSIVGGCHL